MRRARARTGEPLTILRPWPHVLVALAVVVAFMASISPVSAAGASAWVDTGGDCLWLRTGPGLDSSNIRCLDHGAEVTLLDGSTPLDGFTWQQVESEGQTGWVADYYLTTDEADVQVIQEPDPVASTGGFSVPPAGGITIGLATGSDPTVLAATQPYPVISIWYLDIPTQQLKQYIPGAPAFVNTLTSIPSGGFVTIRRQGALVQRGALPEASLTVAGTPNVFVTPPVGGLTYGFSGTTDPRFLAQAQSFTTATISYFHVGSQRWLVYVPGAPEYVNSLRQGMMGVNSIVYIRRGADDPNPPPSSTTSTRFETSITYYYCVPGANPASIGDGGGYCGNMANGEKVYAGAAACSPGLLGQRFIIEGDPTGRTYTCTDTGGSVLKDHRDIWFMSSDDGYAWWAALGSRAVIEVLSP